MNMIILSFFLFYKRRKMSKKIKINENRKKSNIYFSFSKLKRKKKENLPKNKIIKDNKIEEEARRNINLILNNQKKSISNIFDIHFNYRMEEETIKEQYSYMRALYSYLIKMLFNFGILIKQDDIPIISLDEKNDYLINENSHGSFSFGVNLDKDKSFEGNSNSIIKNEKNNTILNLNEEINQEIARDEKYYLICKIFQKYCNGKNKINSNEIKKAIEKKKFLEYQNFINDKKIMEITIYNTENYSIILSRSNGMIYLRLKKLEYVNN